MIDMVRNYKLLRNALIGRKDTYEVTDSERADWAYGNVSVENDGVTREMVERAVMTRKAGR